MLRQVCKIFLSRVENSSSRRKFNITQIRRNFSASMALPVCYHSSHEIPAKESNVTVKWNQVGLLISRREAFGSRTVLEGNSIVEFPRGNSLSREWRGKVESGGRRRVGEGWEVGGERGSRISSVKNREDYSFWIALSIDGYRSMDTGDKNSGKFIRNEIYPGERDICLDWTKPGQS